VTTHDAPPRAGRREWIGLAVLALPTMLLSLDLSVLFLALPHLAADLGADSVQQLWITDIYGFMTAGLLITMGTLGDRIGRRKLLLAGAAAFGVASVLAAYATSPGMLIAARGLMGMVGAALLPSTLALIRNLFGDPKQLGVAVAAWTTFYMAGVALGPVVGGVLLESFWWGSVFLLGVPVMGLLLVVGPLLLPEHRDPAAGRLDPASVALSLAAILPVIYGLKELARYGWQPLPVTAIAVGVALGVAFVARQRALTSPLLDLRLFGIRAVSATLLVGVVVAAVQNGNTLMVAQQLQMVQGLSPLHAGLWLLPASLALVLGINLTPAIARRVRPAYVFAAGLVVSVAGYLLLTQADSAGLAVLIVGVIVAYLGIGPAAALINHLVLGSAPADKAGSAAALTSTSGEFGIALGIATLGSVGTAVYRSQVTVPADVPADAATTAGESIAGAVLAAEHLPANLAAELLDPAREAFTAGLHTVAAISAVLFVGVAIFVVTLLRHIRPTGQPQPDQAEEADSTPAAVPGADHNPAEDPHGP
jgi:DHA2 family multidrug resistance protein-like MFS transporter